MPEELLMLNSGIQTVVPQLATPQYVFLDFDGAVTSYHNRDLGIDLDNILVEDSGFDAETISLIVSTLNGQFDDDIVFTADLPQTDEYSTVYIGTTPAFDDYGSFLGLAETIDIGNQIHDDNAFIFLNSTAFLDTVVYAIAHETEHIVHGMEHGGEGIQRYAARIDVENGAVSNGLTISSGTSMYVISGGTANNTKLNSGGDMFVVNGGTGNRTTVNNWGNLWVSSGGTANATTVNNWGNLYVSSGGTANDTVMSGGRICVFSGGTANSTKLGGGNLYVSNGGTANSTTVNNWGNLYVSSGGTANGTTVNSRGSMYVSSGGTALNIVEYGGNVEIAEGATASFVANVIENLSFYGGMTVHSGTTANATTVNSRGSMYVSSGGTANGTTVNSRGSMYVSSGGTANYTTVNGGYDELYGSEAGNLYVSNGGTANSTTVNSGGGMYVYSGGTANGIVENGGYVSIAEGATASFVANVIENLSLYGGMTVHSGTTANGTMVNSIGSMYVSSGGTANDTVMSGGSMNVRSGGTANDTVMSGGRLYVSSGGTANGTTVNSRGSMYVSSGGVIGGQNSLAASGCLVVSAGAVIDFTVAAQENSGIALIDHYDYISGRNEATYTITIKESQASGQYSLAGYAGDFNSNVSVQTEDGQTIGYITGWRDLEVGGRTYSLSIAPDATLKLTIAGEAIDATAPTITNIKANVTAFTNGDVTVSAVFADETELAQSLYRLGAGDWLAYSGLVTMTDNGTVYFRAVDAAGNVAEAKYEVVNIDKEKPDAVSDLAAVVENNLVTFSWSPTTDNLSGMAGYEIEVSDKSDFSHLVASSSGASLTNYETRFSVSGIYYYRVRATDAAGNASPWTTNQVDYEYVPMAEQLVGTPGDDVFNMVPDGTWGTCHVARWNGGTETVSIAKRNRFHDALVGGVGGYDVVALPDGDNALLYHDLLSPCADGTEASARLAGISEICGNCGNDVIDLTAANGCYAGDLLLKGGDGNDHLWSGFGDDILIGGTGNDDLRGGTGNDLYLFGTDWGHDTVVDDGGTLVFDSALQGNLAVRATDSGTSISDGHNMVSVSWQVEVGDLVFAEVGELQEYRRDTIKAFLA